MLEQKIASFKLELKLEQFDSLYKALLSIILRFIQLQKKSLKEFVGYLKVHLNRLELAPGIHLCFVFTCSVDCLGTLGKKVGLGFCSMGCRDCLQSLKSRHVIFHSVRSEPTDQSIVR